LAIPGKIKKIESTLATFDYDGVDYKADISLLTDVEIGDYVLMHDGRALSKISEPEYLEQLEFITTHEEMACHKH